MTPRSYLHKDQFGLGTAEIMELLSKTEGHCGIRSRNLTLLVQLQGCNMQREGKSLLRCF